MAMGKRHSVLQREGRKLESGGESEKGIVEDGGEYDFELMPKDGFEIECNIQ